MKPRTYVTAITLLSLSATSAFAQNRRVQVRDHRTAPPAPRVYKRAAPAVTSYAPHTGAAGTTVTIYGDNFVESRPSRLARSVATARARWQAAFLASPGAKGELSLHAVRIAKLNRMLRRAKARNNNVGLVARINAAIAKENTRHTRRMTRLEAKFRIG